MIQNSIKHKIIRSFLVAVVFALFAYMFWPFYTAFLLAALFAFGLSNLVQKLIQKKLSRSLAAICVVLGLVIFIVSPLLLISLETVSTLKNLNANGFQNSDVYLKFDTFLHQNTEALLQKAESFGLNLSQLPKPTEFLNQAAQKAGAFAATVVTSVPKAFLNITVFMLMLYYFLTEAHSIKKFILKFDLVSETELEQISLIIQKSSYLTLIASLFIALLQALVISIFSYFCGFNAFFMIFFASFTFALIPVVGSAPVSITLISLSFIQGHTGSGIAMIVAAVVAASLDNLIKPLILNSARESLHPIISLLALIGAVLIYGPAGILLGPILTQLAFNILDIFSPTRPEITESVQNLPSPEV